MPRQGAARRAAAMAMGRGRGRPGAACLPDGDRSIAAPETPPIIVARNKFNAVAQPCTPPIAVLPQCTSEARGSLQPTLRASIFDTDVVETLCEVVTDLREHCAGMEKRLRACESNAGEARALKRRCLDMENEAQRQRNDIAALQQALAQQRSDNQQ